MKSAALGLIGAGMFMGLHTMNAGFGKILAHGMTGGIMSKVSGGSFKAGFLSGGFTQLASMQNVFGKVNQAAGMGLRIKNAFAAAVVGGVSSVLGGGKFKNGAIAGAFSRMFNDWNLTLKGLSAKNAKYPEYETEMGTKIVMNNTPPYTVLPSGETLDSMICTADCSGLGTVVVSGGNEQSYHSNGSLHYENKAVDFAGVGFNNVSKSQLNLCASQCGFTHGQYEVFSNNPSRDHFHYQSESRLGVPSLSQ